MSKVNKGFLKFVNKKKYNKSENNFDLDDNLSDTQDPEEILTSATQKEQKSFHSKKSDPTQNIKENDIIFQNVPRNDNNLNDGSLKSLLERFSGKVIEKEEPQLNITKPEEEEESESESESERNSDSEESDYAEEKYNHFIKNRLDLVQNAEEIEDEAEENYEEEEEFEDKDKKQFNSNSEFKNDGSNNDTFTKVESEIFVDNIPVHLHEKQIVKLLKNANNSISRVKVLKDQNGRPRGKAYLKFSSKKDAMSVIKRGLFIENNRLNLKLVDQSENQNNQNSNFNKTNSSRNPIYLQQDKKEYNGNNYKQSKDYNGINNKKEVNKNQINNSNQNSCTIFVRNLPSEIDENVLKSHLKKFGNIKSVRLMKNSSGKNKNFGYVDYATAESVEKVIKHNEPINVFGKQLVLEKAKSSFDGGVYEEGKRLGKKKKRSLMKKEKDDNNQY